MHHDDVGGASPLRQRSEKVLQRVDAAGGSADEDDHRLGVAVASIPGFVLLAIGVIMIVSHGPILRFTCNSLIRKKTALNLQVPFLLGVLSGETRTPSRRPMNANRNCCC